MSEKAAAGVGISQRSSSASMTKIRELEQELESETPVVKPKVSSLDMYKDEEGNLTYFYKNISSSDIIFSNPNMKEFKKGTSINLTKIFDTVDEMLNFREISNLLQPVGEDPALVRRLTPSEYYEELREQAEIAKKKKQELVSRNKNISPKAAQESISDAVTSQIGQITKYLDLNDEKKQETTYTVYDFIQWINSYNFNRSEYDLMLYSIKNSEVLHAIQQRKQQLIRYGLYAEVSAE